MSEQIYKEEALEKTIRDRFAVKLTIDQMVAHDLPLSRTSYAQLFLTPDKHFYCFIEARSNLNLGDVKKLIGKIGLVADKHLPPGGEDDYFRLVATQKFKSVFPGRIPSSEQDLAFYFTLVPYHPALIQIKEVRDGHLYQFDPDSTSSWRVSKPFSYRRIKTS